VQRSRVNFTGFVYSGKVAHAAIYLRRVIGVAAQDLGVGLQRPCWRQIGQFLRS
jgi:hypothetical protein